MTHIKYKKYGWREPFSTIKSGYTTRNRLIDKTILCPYCGRKNMTHFKEGKHSDNFINSKKAIF